MFFFADSKSKFYGASSLSTLTNSPTSNTKAYEDMLDVDSASVAEAAAIAAGEVTDDGLRVKSEVFDNPIYDQPSLTRSKRNGSMGSVSVRTGDVDSKLGSVSSVRSFSASSCQNYSPPSVRAVEKSIQEDPTARHDYEDIKPNFSGSPRRTASLQGSAQYVCSSEKLTVINESYDYLPCSGNNSMSSLPQSRMQASSVPNCTLRDGHGLAGRPIITEVTISEAFSKRKKAGKVPSTREMECRDNLGANSCDLGANSCDMVEIDLETTEQ